MNHCLWTELISMDVPAAPLRRMGATHIVSVALRCRPKPVDPQNMLSVVTRCFQIMNVRTEIANGGVTARRDSGLKCAMSVGTFRECERSDRSRRASRASGAAAI